MFIVSIERSTRDAEIVVEAEHQHQASSLKCTFPVLSVIKADIQVAVESVKNNFALVAMEEYCYAEEY